VDVQTARNAGVGACGVAWGFQPGAFQQFPPDILVHDPRELLRLGAAATTQNGPKGTPQANLS
jgi:phosphoglycolate phosphatase-like HAD superfamily hydrolase